MLMNFAYFKKCGEFVTIQKFIPLIIFVIFLKKWQFGLENENLEIFQNLVIRP